jgi:hypothetical protein
VNTSTSVILQASLSQAQLAMADGDTPAARRAYRQASLLAPQEAGILLDLATTCLADHDPAQALEHARQAAQLTFGWRVESVLATACRQLNQPDAAAAHLGSALAALDLPALMRRSTLQQLADVQLNAFGDARGAALSLRAAAQGDATLALEAELAGLVADLYEGERSATALSTGFATLAARLRPPVAPGTSAGHGLRAPRSRLRIGLLSQQFCASPVGFLTLGALTELARDADLLFFDRGAKADWAHSAFQAIARHWLPCAALDARQLHRLLSEADLDAVIDLSGWTDVPALRALAGRPVVRQLKWVGGQSLSTGLRCFDGFVTDARQAPAAAARLYTEPLLRAQHGYVTYRAASYAPELAAAAARPPEPKGRPARGVYALVSNPAKISAATVAALQALQPRKLLLIDQRWRHEGTRQAAGRRLGALLDKAEFITPASHPEYLQTLARLDASFVDTRPYSMGLTAIELRLLGKHIITSPPSPVALMAQRHCSAHLGARRFDHHAELAGQLLGWCKA